MGMDRFITWGPAPEWGHPTLERLAAVAQNFLGPEWKVTHDGDNWIVCENGQPQRWALLSEYVPGDADPIAFQESYGSQRTRGFEVFFEGVGVEDQTSVITRQADEFTGALADQYTKIIARWWQGTIEWPS